MFQQFFSSLPNKTGLYGRRDTYRGPPYSSRSYAYRDDEETDQNRDENGLNAQGQVNDYYGLHNNANYKEEANNEDVNYGSQDSSNYDAQRGMPYGNHRTSNYRGQVSSQYGNQGQNPYEDQRSSSYYGNQDTRENNYSNVHSESPYRSRKYYGGSYDIFDAPASAYGPKNGSERCIPKCFAEKGNRVRF